VLDPGDWNTKTVFNAWSLNIQAEVRKKQIYNTFIINFYKNYGK